MPSQVVLDRLDRVKCVIEGFLVARKEVLMMWAVVFRGEIDHIRRLGH